MANDCLVTKLKGVVNNNNLTKLDELEIEFITSGFFSVTCFQDNPIVVRANAQVLSFSENGPFVDELVASEEHEYSPGSGYVIIYISNPSKVFVDQKYRNLLLAIDSNTKAKLNVSYCSRLNRFIISQPIGNIGELPITLNTVEVGNYSSNCAGFALADSVYNNLNNFSSFTAFDMSVEEIVEKFINVTSLQIYASDDGKYGVKGSFNLLGKLKYITVLYGTLTEGTIEGFVENARKPVEQGGAGRSTGSISYRYLGKSGGITFNGTPIIYDGTDRTFSWTESTITCDGTTINA